jgi:hypothetical protein
MSSIKGIFLLPIRIVAPVEIAEAGAVNRIVCCHVSAANGVVANRMTRCHFGQKFARQAVIPTIAFVTLPPEGFSRRRAACQVSEIWRSANSVFAWSDDAIGVKRVLNR